MFKPFVTLLASLAVTAVAAGSASAATPDAPWTASGTGTVKATSDGTASNPVLDYSVAGSSGSWTFSATAKTAGKQSVKWHYKGYHAWFQVRVGIQKYIISGGKEIVTESLASAGPVNCCAAPSGGFDYAGTTSFALKPGDVYGFRMTGSHFDSDRRLIGTLSLTPELQAPPASLDSQIGTLLTQIQARATQIQKLNADLTAARAAGDTKKVDDLQRQLALLNDQNKQDEYKLQALMAQFQGSSDAMSAMLAAIKAAKEAATRNLG